MASISKILFTSLFTALIATTSLVGCSSAPVQTKRLNTVEDLLLEAEYAVSRNPGLSSKEEYARQNLDTASAYLLTLRDNKKNFSPVQLKRYQNLSQRVSALKKRLDQ